MEQNKINPNKIYQQKALKILKSTDGSAIILGTFITFATEIKFPIFGNIKKKRIWQTKL